MVRFLNNINPTSNNNISDAGEDDYPSDPSFSTLTVNGVTSMNGNLDASGQTVQGGLVVGDTVRTSTVSAKDGAGETLQILANFVTRPVGSTLQLAPDTITATSTISTQSNITAGTSINATDSIISDTGRIEAILGQIKGNSAEINTQLDVGSIRVIKGVYESQQIQCGRFNFSSGAHDGWEISQGDSGSDFQDALAVVAPNASGSFNVIDFESNPLVVISKLGTIINTPTNNINGDVILGSSKNLNFGAFTFKPVQYMRTIPTFTIRSTDDTVNFTNRLFDFRSNTDWVNVNTGASNQNLYITSSEGFYKCSVFLEGSSSGGSFTFVRVLFDFVLCFSVQSSPDTQPPITFSYRVKPVNASPSVHVNFLASPVQSQPVYLNFANETGNETFTNVVVRLTKMDW